MDISNVQVGQEIEAVREGLTAKGKVTHIDNYGSPWIGSFKVRSSDRITLIKDVEGDPYPEYQAVQVAWQAFSNRGSEALEPYLRDPDQSANWIREVRALAEYWGVEL